MSTNWSQNAATVNRLPYPLLDLFGVKQGGRYPDQLAQFYQPSIDVTPLMLVDNRRINTGATVNIAALGNSNFNASVPNDQTWYVHDFWLGVPTLGAGQSISVRCFVTDPNTGVPWITGDPSPVATVGQQTTASLRNVWLPPGTIFGVQTLVLAAGPVNGVSAQIVYSAFQR